MLAALRALTTRTFVVLFASLPLVLAAAGPASQQTIARDANRAAARHEAESVELDIAWQEWQAALGAKLHATRVLWLSAQRTELERQLDEVSRTAAAAEGNLRVGLVTRIEADAAAAMVQKRRAAFLAVQATHRSESAQLRQALGLPPGARVEVADAEDSADPPAPSGAGRSPSSPSIWTR